MNTFHSVLLTAIIVLVMLSSCNDISNLGDNSGKVIIGTTLSAKDTLGFLLMDPINFDTLAKGRIKYKSIVFTNISDTITVIIYSVQFKNNLGFTLVPQSGFPVVILPKHDNSDNFFTAEFNTNLVEPGYYKDTIYFNGLTKFKTTIEAFVRMP
jgi:hypothetical protein